ncbi:MAG: methyltransferase domain-containing protein [Chthoniobacterales bacterium]
MKQTQIDWQEAYEKRETPWEKGKAHPALLDFLASDGPLAGEIFVPGCGSGHDVRALSTPQNHVLGIDLAPFAIEQARSFPKVGNEEYQLADLFALPPELDGKFDVVFEHTCFCAIDPIRRAEYADAIVRLLRPGGKFIAIFFPNPDIDEDEGPPFPVSVAKLEKIFGRFFTVVGEWIPAQTHPGREGRELMRVLMRLP